MDAKELIKNNRTFIKKAAKEIGDFIKNATPEQKRKATEKAGMDIENFRHYSKGAAVSVEKYQLIIESITYAKNYGYGI